MWIDKKYLSFLSGRLRNFKLKSNNPYLVNFSCPFCGDSAIDKRKARGYAYGNNGLVYKCHNCGISTSFSNLLKKVDNRLYEEYIFEKFKSNDTNQEIIEEKKDKIKISLEDICIPIEKSPIGMKYLMDRKLPKDKIKDFYFIENFSNLKQIIPSYKDYSFPNDARIIIPVRNRISEIIALSCRAINRTKLRYINLKFNDDPMIYGLDKININEKVYVLEGVFDSLFLENSVAVSGSDLEKIKSFLSNPIFIFDNQPRNKEIVHKMISLSKRKYKLVVWPKWIQEYGKDINEYVLNGLSAETIINTINNNTFSGLSSVAMISNWRLI